MTNALRAGSVPASTASAAEVVGEGIFLNGELGGWTWRWLGYEHLSPPFAAWWPQETAHVETLEQQPVENIANRAPFSLVTVDARERHLQKPQITDDTALGKKMPSLKH